MKTKEELLKYLAEHSNLELPFNPIVWERAVENTENKKRSFKVIKTKEHDGKVKTTKVPNGSTNPVSMYFQLMALPQYQAPYVPDKDEDYEGETFDLDDEEVTEVITDLENQDEGIGNLVNTFFAGYSPSDKKWILGRLSDYYNNYSLNEGADKMLVLKAVADELEIMKLNQQRAMGRDVSKSLESTQKGYLDLLESLKALKKQRSKMDEQGSNKFTVFMDKLEREGEFKPPKIEYKDDIDKMLELFEESIRRTLK